MNKYFHDWASIDDLHRDFMDYGQFENGLRIDGFPSDDEILFASYAPGCYCGDSIVVYEREGALYINEAGHCSCFGLEGAWEPDRIEPEQLFGHIPDENSDHDEDARLAMKSLAEKLNGGLQ